MVLPVSKVAVFYFSGTGNTWWVANRLAASLRDMGADAACFSVEQVDTGSADRLIAGCDVVGFGYPVYASDLPEIMKTFMSGLTPVCKDVFIFCSQWLWSGDGARVGTEFLDSEFRVKWAEHFAMPNNVSVSVFRLPYTNDKRRIERVLKKTEAKIQRFARRIMSGKPFLRGFNSVSVFSGYLQRHPFRSMYHRLRNDISIDRGKCISCGYCLKLCPAGNLCSAGDTINTRGTCILCLRCYSFCPAMAVKYMNRLHIPGRGEPYRGPVAGFKPEIMQRGASEIIKPAVLHE